MNDSTDRIRLRLEEHWPQSKECPVCGEAGWAIGQIVQMTLADDHGLQYSFVPVSCTTCANTLFFNAQQMGFAASIPSS